MLTWMYDNAPEEERNLLGQASRMIVMNFAAIHTSGIVRLSIPLKSTTEINTFSG
jgi:hypothetical protein